jgi:hypothetical protein
LKPLFIVVLLDSAVGMSRCAASGGGIEGSELARIWKEAVLLHLEVLLQFLPVKTEENCNKLDTEVVLARVRA